MPIRHHMRSPCRDDRVPDLRFGVARRLKPSLTGRPIGSGNLQVPVIGLQGSHANSQPNKPKV
jgi:hypothetical protein